MQFDLFDRERDWSMRQGNLPHWFQPGVTYFVTFRTEDSVPGALVADWRRRKARWLHEHGVDPESREWKIALLRLPAPVQHEFHRTFTVEFDNYLDRGFGACVLRQPTLAKIVAESLHHAHDVHYRVGDFVVMPNHVHLLCCLLGGTDIEDQCKSWKRFTARKINAALGQMGRFWQEESFDHLVRSPEQFDHLRSYIAENPLHARLKDGEFLYYQCSMGG
jgi:putative transposase